MNYNESKLFLNVARMELKYNGKVLVVVEYGVETGLISHLLYQ